MDFDQIYEDGKSWICRPFNSDMSIGQLLLVFVLFLIVGYVVFDMLRILKSWMDTATETVVSAVS